MGRMAFYTDEAMRDAARGTYTVALSEEGTPGYAPVSPGWRTLDAAKSYADAENEKLGLTADDVTRIIASAMGAQRVPALSDADAMEGITAVLNGAEWDADAMNAVANIARATGRTIADVGH